MATTSCKADTSATVTGKNSFSSSISRSNMNNAKKMENSISTSYATPRRETKTISQQFDLFICVDQKYIFVIS
jgi:hypothetical protein